MNGMDLQSERGQTAVFFTVFAVVLAMSAGIVVEAGRLYLEKRDMQGVADASAMAGVRSIPTSSNSAKDLAQEYAEVKQSDGATLVSASTTSDSITVTVENTIGSDFLGFFDAAEANTVTADATAMVRTAGGVGRALPMALMDGSFNALEVTEIKTQNAAGPGNHGAVRLAEAPACSLTNGSNDFRDLIVTAAGGGADSCPTEIGGTIQTETGNMAGPSNQGLDDRLAGNEDTFEDCFQWDAEVGRYIVIKPDSPRVGVVPIIDNPDDPGTWPNGQSDLEIVGYTMVYIGDEDAVAYTEGGKSVWIQPVPDAVLPSTFTSTHTEYDPNAQAPIVFRLTE